MTAWLAVALAWTSGALMRAAMWWHPEAVQRYVWGTSALPGRRR